MLELNTNFKKLNTGIFFGGCIVFLSIFSAIIVLLKIDIQTESIILTLGKVLTVGCMSSVGLLILKDLVPLIILSYKKTNVIFSFSEKGFTDYRTNKKYYWENLESIRSESIEARVLVVKLKDNLGTIYLSEICVSKETYKKMIVHILKYAPKNLTQGVGFPIYTDKNEVALELVKVGFILAIVYFISRNV